MAIPTFQQILGKGMSDIFKSDSDVAKMDAEIKKLDAVLGVQQYRAPANIPAGSAAPANVTHVMEFPPADNLAVSRGALLLGRLQMKAFPGDKLKAVLIYTSSGKVFINAITKNDESVAFEEDPKIFPSDSLVASWTLLLDGLE